MVPSTVPALPALPPPGRPPPRPKATPGMRFVARLIAITRLALIDLVGLPCHAVRGSQVAHTDVAEKDIFGGSVGEAREAGGRRQEAGAGAGGRRQEAGDRRQEVGGRGRRHGKD